MPSATTAGSIAVVSVSGERKYDVGLSFIDHKEEQTQLYRGGEILGQFRPCLRSEGLLVYNSNLMKLLSELWSSVNIFGRYHTLLMLLYNTHASDR